MRYTIFSIIALLLLSSCAVTKTTPKHIVLKYEWFENTYTSIQSVEKNINRTELDIDSFKSVFGSPISWDWQTREEYSRLQTIRRGYIDNYNSLVSEYNANSSKFNWVYFKGDLPKKLIDYKL